MAHVRPPAVAGLFYPRSATALRRDVEGYLDDAAPLVVGRSAAKAVIVPHAGYVYSGSTAALAYALVRAHRAAYRRVLLLGPCHRVPVRGLALSSADAWRTPLGGVPLADPTGLIGLPVVGIGDGAHAPEHSLEVQLPFLQQACGEVELLPLAVGEATGEEVADVIEAAWGGPETLIVISSDLSHYLPYAAAREADAGTIADILARRTPLTHRQACGATVINGMLTACRRRGLHPELLGACNSGDTAGDRSRVVGYASFAIEEATT